MWPSVFRAATGRLRGPAALAAIFAAYGALAVAATWPLAARSSDHLFGVGTPPLNVWAMDFVVHQIARAPLRLFDGNAFYPYAGTLAFSEHLFVPALLSAPFIWATGNPVLGHNVVALLTLALAGTGMYLLARELTRDGGASFAAGVLYAFHTWNINELARLQILSNAWFPLLLLGLLRYFARPSAGRAALAGLAYLLQSLSCMYWALYAPLVTLPALAALQWRWRLPLRRLAPLAAALAVALLALLPFLWPYARGAGELGFGRALPEPLALDRYFDVLPGNRLYAEWLGTAKVNQDAAHFLGFAALGLGLVGALRGRVAPEAGVGRGFFTALACAGLLLSLGPQIIAGERTLGPGPYALLYHFVPGFAHVRYPERFSLVLLLGLAPLVAAGLARLGPRLRTPGLACAAALIFAEHFSAPLRLEPIATGSRVPAVYRWLADRDDVRVVAEVPATRHLLERADALPMYFSCVHRKRTVQGFTGYFPPAYTFMRWRLYHWPAPETLDWLERFGVDTLVLGAGAPDPPADAARFRLVGPFPGGQRVVRLLRAGAQAYAPPADDERGLVEVARDGWTVRASHPDAQLAVDGLAHSAWSTPEPQGRGDFYLVRFARPVRLARVSLELREPDAFPTRLKLLGYAEGGGPIELPFDRRAAYDRLFATLLHQPRAARLELDVAPVTVSAVRLRVDAHDGFGSPWSVAELRVFEAPAEAAAYSAAAAGARRRPARSSSATTSATKATPTSVPPVPAIQVKPRSAKCSPPSQALQPASGQALRAATISAIATPASPSPAIRPEAASTPWSLSPAAAPRFASTTRRTTPPTKIGVRLPSGR